MAPEPADVPSGARSLAFLRGVGSVLQRLSRPVAVVPVLLWAGLIYFLSSRPPRTVTDHVTVKVLLANCAHAVEYGMLALLLALTLPRAAGWPRLDARGVGLTLALVLVYAISDELHQGVTPGRNASVPDVVTDLVGAACTLWIAAYVARADATEAGLARRFGLGLLACVVSGGIATFLPAAFPDVVWL